MRFRQCSRIPFRRRRREAAFWTSFFLIAVLLAVALDFRWLQKRAAEEVSSARHLEESGISAFVNDPLIDMPVRHADNKYWIFVHVLVIAYMLLGLNTVCDAYFTGALDTMVNRWDIKPDVAGATFMAAGGSAPELFTSLIGATISESDVGFGTIVGSAVFNVLFVIGLCGFAASEPIKLTWWPLARDCACYLCGLSLLALFAKTGQQDAQEIELWEALVLFSAYLAYCTLMYFNENLEALLVKTPLLPATGCSSSQPVAPSADKTPQGDIMLRLTQVTPMGDTGGSAEPQGSEAVAADLPAIMVTPAAPSGPPPPLPSNCANASPPNSPGVPVDSSDSEKHHHHHHHHIKKSQPHFARHHHVSVHGNGEMVASVSGTLSAMLRKPSTHTSPSEGAGAAWDATDARSKDGDDRVESQAADDASTAPSPDDKADPEHSDDNEDGGADVLDIYGDDDSEESDEEDDIEALMIMPDERFGQVVWILSLPIYAPLYYFTPKPDARCFLATFGISLLWIASFSLFLVYCVEVLGEVLHIHIIIMGFTLLAAGTSIPDAVSSVAVARAGEGDMAVSSSIGSNIFDILVGLPIPWVVKIGFVEMASKGKPHAVVAIESPYIVLYVLILVFMVFSVILSIHLNGWVLNKMLGIGMGGLYIIFLVTVLTVEFERPSALKF